MNILYFIAETLRPTVRACDAGDVNLAGRVLRAAIRLAWLRATLPARLLLIRLRFFCLDVIRRTRYRMLMWRSDVRFQFRMLALRWR